MLVRRYKKLTAIFTFFSIAYIMLSILLPVDKTALVKYHIDRAQLVGLTLTVTIPYLIIWFIALVGYLGLRSYNYTIRKSKDGKAFLPLTRGVFVLALWLPISALADVLGTAYYRAHPSASATMVILNNYLNLLILFTGFWLIYKGSKRMLAIIRKPELSLPWSIMFAYILFASFYTFLVLRDPARQFPNHHVLVASYYLPDWLTMVTVVIPRLITWFIGVQATYNIYLYGKYVKGLLYQEALSNLARGIAGVVLSVVALRCFQSLSIQLYDLSLASILLVVYLLLVLISIGYIFIAQGAHKLQQIEEI